MMIAPNEYWPAEERRGDIDETDYSACDGWILPASGPEVDGPKLLALDEVVDKARIVVIGDPPRS